ncbi:diacylglycerol kinase family lipid kinase [Seonamhaeicola sp. MEBiC1930]|uniref:diacylglycerol/lipid kinase family protein n=1 Tax=Seonamhaeicola sp. MEBiC01930 TaxID=2976768 RepID=UPI00325217B3
MQKDSKQWFVIINPTSGNGKAKQKWPEIKRLLHHYKFDFEFAFTEYSKHSVSLVQKALKNSFKHIICVGGDGTLHNTINGIMNQSEIPSSAINIGVIPIGTGNDWIKTHAIANHIESAIKIISEGYIAYQDLGKIEFENSNKPSVYFNNLAGIGFDGYVVSKVERYKKWGALAYLFGALSGIFSFNNFESKVTINSKEISGKTLMILVGLCKYSGGGMRLTDSPNPFDGLLDISIAQNLNKFEIITNLPRLFNGKITKHKKVKTLKTDALKIEVDENKLPFIQADGELIGTGNFKVSILAKAFSFYRKKNPDLF